MSVQGANSQCSLILSQLGETSILYFDFNKSEYKSIFGFIIIYIERCQNYNKSSHFQMIKLKKKYNSDTAMIK